MVSILSLREDLSFSHRRTQKNRTHRVQKDDGPSPVSRCPSPEGKGIGGGSPVVGEG